MTAARRATRLRPYIPEHYSVAFEAVKCRPERLESPVSTLGRFLEVIGAHKRIASDLYREKRYSLRCHECDHVREISKQEFAGYLAGGWPKHCRVTMGLESEAR